jgi:hypothetical protein
MGAFMWLLSSSTLLWDDGMTKYTLVWEVILFIAIIMGAIMFVLKSLPDAVLDGKETLEQYRKAKAEREQEQSISGRH